MVCLKKELQEVEFMSSREYLNYYSIHTSYMHGNEHTHACTPGPVSPPKGGGVRVIRLLVSC